MIPNPTSVLVVDDELDNCRNLSDILSAVGYHVDVATDGPAALELVRRRPYDVALLDLRMPGMDGLTLSREIRKIRSATSSMIVTAYASSETALRAVDEGVSGVMSKPVNVDSLLSTIACLAANRPQTSAN